MVNTFLTELDFKASARNLDRSRLGKQRTEAWQIWLLHQDLKVLAKYFGFPLEPPSNSSPLAYFRGAQQWADQIIQHYKSQDYLLAIEPMFLTIIPKTTAHLYKSISASVSYRIEADQVVWGTQKNPTRWPRAQTFIAAEGERLIKLGFINHPACRMWLGYTDSLLDYINAHIEVWEERGYQNKSLEAYPLDYSPPKPFWLNSDFIQNHRTMLYHKMPDYYIEWESEPTQYFWPDQIYKE